MKNSYSWILSLICGTFNLGCNDTSQYPSPPTTTTVTPPKYNAMPWTGYELAQKQAQKNDKLVLLYFYADWCPYCTTTNNSVWKNQKVIDLIYDKQYICVKIDIEKRQDLMSEYNVKGVPRILLVDVDKEGNKTVESKIKGYYDDIHIYLDLLNP